MSTKNNRRLGRLAAAGAAILLGLGMGAPAYAAGGDPAFYNGVGDEQTPTLIAVPGTDGVTHGTHLEATSDAGRQSSNGGTESGVGAMGWTIIDRDAAKDIDAVLEVVNSGASDYALNEVFQLPYTGVIASSYDKSVADGTPILRVDADRLTSDVLAPEGAPDVHVGNYLVEAPNEAKGTTVKVPAGAAATIDPATWPNLVQTQLTGTLHAGEHLTLRVPLKLEHKDTVNVETAKVDLNARAYSTERSRARLAISIGVRNASSDEETIDSITGQYLGTTKDPETGEYTAIPADAQAQMPEVDIARDLSIRAHGAADYRDIAPGDGSEIYSGGQLHIKLAAIQDAMRTNGYSVEQDAATNVPWEYYSYHDYPSSYIDVADSTETQGHDPSSDEAAGEPAGDEAKISSLYVELHEVINAQDATVQAPKGWAPGDDFPATDADGAKLVAPGLNWVKDPFNVVLADTADGELEALPEGVTLDLTPVDDTTFSATYTWTPKDATADSPQTISKTVLITVVPQQDEPVVPAAGEQPEQPSSTPSEPAAEPSEPAAGQPQASWQAAGTTAAAKPSDEDQPSQPGLPSAGADGAEASSVLPAAPIGVGIAVVVLGGAAIMVRKHLA